MAEVERIIDKVYNHIGRKIFTIELIYIPSKGFNHKINKIRR